VNGFYLLAMRCAPVILFVIALVAFVSTLWLGIEALSAFDGSPYSPGAPSITVAAVFRALGGAFQSAGLPLFGAALLWRLDRRAPKDGGAE